MTTPTQPVTCRFFDQDGTPMAVRVSFKLAVQEAYNGLIVAAVEDYVITNALTGLGVINLFPNALGANSSQYTVKAVDTKTGRKVLDTLCTIPNSPCYLDLILNQEPFPTIDAAGVALVASQGALALATAQADIATANAALTAADVVLTHADVVLTAADRGATHADAQAAAADRADIHTNWQYKLDTVAAQATVATTQAGIATAKAVLTAADATATAADRVQTGLDKVSTSANAAQTALDAAATSADLAQTGLDRTATTGSASAANVSASTATTQAGNAATSAAAALGSENAAALSAGSASTSAATATAQQTIATTKAGEAAASAATAVAKADEAATSAGTFATSLSAHTGNVANPHSVTKAQVGLGNVDNTSDTSKPVSTAQQTALNLKANLASPTFTGTVGGITAAMVGAPSGSGTSTGNNTGDQVIPTTLPASDVSPWAKATTKPTYTKTEVGLGNVDNTADAAKSVLYAGAAGSAFAQTLLDDTTAAGARTTLGAAASGANTDITSLGGLTSSVSAAFGTFHKADFTTVAFTKLTASTAEIKAGTIIDVDGTIVSFAAATAITMPALTAGTDYSIWVTPAGALQAVADPYSAPATAPVAGSRKIGGFHYGLVADGTTVAGGSFATTGNGMIWTQANVDAIAGIDTFSFWDLKWRCAGEQRGMAFDPYVRCWAAIYWCSSNHIANGISAYNTGVASGTVLPLIPLAYGGNGTTAYANGNWWTFGEVAASFGLRLPTEREFVSAAYGVTENQSLGGASSTIPSTARQAGYTSRIGIEQATGHIWAWGADSSTRWDGAATPWNWRNVNGGRGQLYLYGDSNLVRVLLGGARGSAAFSGSRASDWSGYPWGSVWNIGLRAFGDHLMLA